MDNMLSIIIPVYNVKKYLTQCLKSILIENKACLERVEVIVVDDGSTDSSGVLADEFAGQYPCVRVIHKKNAGVAAARNTGIDIACGKWLYFVDSDDWLESGGLEKICEEAVRNPHADMIFMEAYENVGHRQREWVHFTMDADLTDPESIRRLQGAVLYAPFWSRTGNDPMAAPWDKVYRRDFLIENHLLFCERLKVLDDMVFNFEVLGAARHVACRKVKPYHYRRVPDSITNSYRPDRVVQDMEVWKYLFSQKLWDHGKGDILRRAMYCRMIKSFSICCRLCFFNRSNEKTLMQKTAYVKQVMGKKPYSDAFRAVRLSDLEWQLKFVTIAGRLRSGLGVYLLHIGRESILACRRRWRYV